PLRSLPARSFPVRSLPVRSLPVRRGPCFARPAPLRRPRGVRSSRVVVGARGPPTQEARTTLALVRPQSPTRSHALGGGTPRTRARRYLCLFHPRETTSGCGGRRIGLLAPHTWHNRRPAPLWLAV